MDFVNQTKVEAGWTLGFEPDGRELLVVVIKATYQIPENGEEVRLADKQAPLTESDLFTNESGLSATLYETDYAHRKPFCDVLLNGSAYAPDGRPTTKVTVGMQVGSLTKVFNVVGNRVWDKSVVPSSPKPFVQFPISYDCAFGGIDIDEKNPKKQATYLQNPVGVGYYPITKGSALEGKPLANTEEISHPISSVNGKFNSMSFGSIGRNFQSRFPFAGTYDQNWFDKKVPLWPDDFDYRYFQSAPMDQQINYPKGGELIVLRNLTSSGHITFKLPKVSMPVLLIPYRGNKRQVDAVIDTLVIEPDKKRLMITLRVSFSLHRNCFELKQVIAGEIPKTQHRDRTFGKKPYYRNLAELVKARRLR